MKTLIFLSIILGATWGAAPWIFAPKEPQVLEVEPFWKVNGAYVAEGEIYEVFYPPLDKLPVLEEIKP